jgi:hypothetical protein
VVVGIAAAVVFGLILLFGLGWGRPGDLKAPLVTVGQVPRELPGPVGDAREVGHGWPRAFNQWRNHKEQRKQFRLSDRTLCAARGCAAAHRAGRAVLLPPALPTIGRAPAEVAGEPTPSFWRMTLMIIRNGGELIATAHRCARRHEKQRHETPRAGDDNGHGD